MALDEEWSISSEIDDCEPTLEELDKLYALLEAGGTIELNWKCPGKRAPSPAPKLGDAKPSDAKDQKQNHSKNLEFDFNDDIALPQMRRNLTPKSNVKKKTTNFAGVIDQMRKHGRFAPSPQVAAQNSSPTAAAAAAAAAGVAITPTQVKVAPTAAGVAAGTPAMTTIVAAPSQQEQQTATKS